MTLQQAQCNLIGMIFNKNYIVLGYADEIVILSQSKVYMTWTFNKIETEAKRYSLIVKDEKNKIMQLKRHATSQTET
jgi:hypothetical protein